MKTIETAQEILERMTYEGATVSTAESCTSGRIAALLTQVSGSSDYYEGGLVVYQDHLKMKHLGVKAEDIREHDVVSREVAEQMVRGCCQFFKTDYAIASTGYTGTGNERVASGTVWIAWGTAERVESRCLTGDLGRNENAERAAQSAIEEFLKFIKR